MKVRSGFIASIGNTPLIKLRAASEATGKPFSINQRLAIDTLALGRDSAKLFSEDDRLHSRDFKPLAAADILARHHVVFPHHVGLRLGKARPVALIGMARQPITLAPHQPRKLILVRLAAVRTSEHMGALFILLIEKVAFIHSK